MALECSLPPNLAAAALRELNETPNVRREALRKLRRKITETASFDERGDGTFLLRFLRSKKFDVGKSFIVYENYHLFRSRNAEIFDGLEPVAVRHVWDAGLLGVLRGRDREGRGVMVAFPGRWDPEEHSLEDVLRALVLQLEYLIESEETQITGIVLIADFSDFSLYQARCLRPWYCQMMASLVQNAFPARFKGVYIVNQPWYISIVLSLTRPFLSEKMSSRIHLIGTDLESLQEHFSPEVLPDELGGSLPPHSSEFVHTVVEAHERKKSASSINSAGEEDTTSR